MPKIIVTSRYIKPNANKRFGNFVKYIATREFSVSKGVKEKANTNRGLYRLTDNFFRFWYAFVFTNFSKLESGNVDGVFKYSIEPSLHEFAAKTNRR